MHHATGAHPWAKARSHDINRWATETLQGVRRFYLHAMLVGLYLELEGHPPKKQQHIPPFMGNETNLPNCLRMGYVNMLVPEKVLLDHLLRHSLSLEACHRCYLKGFEIPSSEAQAKRIVHYLCDPSSE